MIQKEHLTDAVVCHENDNILEVSRILRDTQRRHLFVIDKDDKPVGVISAVDINNRVVAEEKNVKKTKAKEIMTKNIETVSVEENYEKAFQIMIRLGTNSIPVLRNNKLFGLLEFKTAFEIKDKEVKK